MGLAFLVDLDLFFLEDPQYFGSILLKCIVNKLSAEAPRGWDTALLISSDWRSLS